MPEEDVEQLLVSLILDNRIQGHIDQVNRLLERGDRLDFIFECSSVVLSPLSSMLFTLVYQLTRSKGMKKYAAVEKWNTQLKSLYQTISNRVG